VQGRIWSVGLTIDPQTGDAQASGLLDHTAELTAGSPIGNVSSFGLDAEGELYVVSHSRGTITKVLGPLSAPAAPTGVRIIRN
jgi:hypothetical protein